MGYFPSPVRLRLCLICFLCCHLTRGRCCVWMTAHATGVLGEQGRGTVEHYGSAASGVRILSTHTLSKALGGHGGVIAGDAALVARLRDGPTPGASSPAPLPAAAASAWALDYMACHPERRQALWRNVAYARRRLRVLGWNLPETPVPILCLHGRSEVDLARLQEALLVARSLRGARHAL